MPSGADAGPERVIGRYVLYGEIASGGMATVHYGRLLGAAGFSRTVAIKRLHSQYARDPEFVSMFLDEARLAARIRHPNAIPTLDVVVLDGELFLVMEYVQGESLSRLLRLQRGAGEVVPLAIIGAVIGGALHGLHAAHEARSEQGEPLGLVHRDVSPHNVMVGTDGVARVLDFGVAKAAGRVQTTREGQIKGKLPYMSPEQIRGEAIDRRVDVYASAVVLWEMLAGRPLFRADNDGLLFAKVIRGAEEPPSRHRPGLASAVDAVVMRALALDPAARFATAQEMAIAVEEATGVAAPRLVGEWTERLAGASIAERAERIKEIESSSSAASVAALADFRGPPGAGSNAGRPSDPPAAGRAVATIDPQSQVSSVSLASSSSLGPAPTSRTPYFVGAAIGLALLVGATSMWMNRDGTVAGPGPSSAHAEQRSAGVAPLTAIATAAPEALATPPSAAPTVSATAPTPTAAAASVPRKKPSPTAVRPAPARNCSPPFTVDSQGIKRPKPECL